MWRMSNYWSAWMAGWAGAVKAILTAQQRALEPFLQVPQVPPAGTSLAATAGDKPRLPPRRRGRPPKSAGPSTPRRRGRPPKGAPRRS